MASVGIEERKKLKLYSYSWSSCSWRVRIALNLKGLEYEYKPVNSGKGEQFSPEFLKLNPIAYVPVLVDDDTVVTDSFAILMYLEEKYPQHPSLPHDLQKRAINYQTQFPLLSRFNEAYYQLPAFQDAMPEKQPDMPFIPMN